MQSFVEQLKESGTAKEFLQQYKKIGRMIENKRAEMEQWQMIATGTTSFSSGERVQSSGSQQKMADAIVRFVDIENEIKNDINKLIDAREDIVNVIQQLKWYEYDLLHKVYIQNYTLAEVAYMNEKSYTSITTAHGRALKSVQRILDERRK